MTCAILAGGGHSKMKLTKFPPDNQKGRKINIGIQINQVQQAHLTRELILLRESGRNWPKEAMYRLKPET